MKVISYSHCITGTVAKSRRDTSPAGSLSDYRIMK